MPIKQARDLRAGDHFVLEISDEFGGATLIEFTALTVTTATPLHAPHEARTRIWADTGQPSAGPGAGNIKMPIDLPAEVEIEVAPSMRPL